MGSLSLEKVDRLLWLGRYIERSLTTLQFILVTYDKSLDSVEGNWKGQLEELGFDQDSGDPQEFFNECLFSMQNTSSIRFAMNAAMDNAVALRDAIGTESVAYVQLALNEVIKAETSDVPLLDLQSMIDYIMAFKGCCDDFIADDSARNIIKCGISLERMDLYLRLNYHLNEVRKETHKLASRIDRTGMPYDRATFKKLIEKVFAADFPAQTTYEDLGEMLEYVAGVF